MKADEEDLILRREFQNATGTGPPQPSWGDIEARAGGFSLRWQRRRLKGVPALAVLLAIVAVPTLAYAARSVFFESAPAPFQSAIYAFALVGGPPGTPADTPAVVAEPRQVLTVSLPDDRTAALLVAPTIDGNYCFDTQVVKGDPDSPGLGLAWGYGYSGFPGCGEHDGALDVGYDITTTSDSPPFILISGGSGLRAADSVEVRYEDGSTTSAPTVNVSSPVDAVFFMFQIPIDHTQTGSRPIELILRAQDNSILTRDEEIFSTLWRNYDGSVAAAMSVGPDSPACNYGEQPEDGSIVPPECQYDNSGAGSVSSRPNSPRYQQRDFEYPGNAHP
jgi:hypothetical protein